MRSLTSLLFFICCTLFFLSHHLPLATADDDDDEDRPMVEPDTSDKAWENFKAKFSREYADNDEEENRRKIWEENVNSVAKHNQAYLAGQQTYSLALNQFSDYTQEERNKYMKGYSGFAEVEEINVFEEDENEASDDTD